MPNLIFKMSAMVGDQFFWNFESSNDVVKEKEGCGGCRIVECWHRFGPFSEIVNRHDDIFMVTSRWRSTFHEVDGPLTKRINCDEGMEGSGGSSCLRGEMLEIGTVFEGFNAIAEERRPKIPSAHDFLGGGEIGRAHV